MEFALLLALAFTVNKIVTVIKSVGKDNNMVITQLLVWVVGVLAIFAGGNAEILENLVLPGLDQAIGDLDFLSVVLVGLMLGSTGSFAYDGLKSIDNTRSAAEPSLMKN